MTDLIMQQELLSEMTGDALVAALVVEVMALRETQDSLLTLLAEIQCQIGPMLDGLKSSPILKMLGV
jgi:hypothetical protein